jgi:hypothetical protein
MINVYDGTKVGNILGYAKKCPGILFGEKGTLFFAVE